MIYTWFCDLRCDSFLRSAAAASSAACIARFFAFFCLFRSFFTSAGVRLSENTKNIPVIYWNFKRHWHWWNCKTYALFGHWFYRNSEKRKSPRATGNITHKTKVGVSSLLNFLARRFYVCVVYCWILSHHFTNARLMLQDENLACCKTAVWYLLLSPTLLILGEREFPNSQKNIACLCGIVSISNADRYKIQ